MIASFSIANFRSFAGEETFSMVASNQFTGHPDHLVAVPGSNEKLLRVAVLYGANGAGKSNFFRAFRYLRSVALRSGSKRDPSRLAADGASASAPSEFDLQFLANGVLYRYGFKVDDANITEEWLTRLNGERESTLFERVTRPGRSVEVDASGIPREYKKIHAQANAGAHPAHSFLATVFINQLPSEWGEDLTAVFLWFHQGLVTIGPEDQYNGLSQVLYDDPELRYFAGAVLNAASTGVSSLETSRDDLEVMPNAAPVRRGPESGKPFSIKVRATHPASDGGQLTLDISEESDGTRRLLNLVPDLYRQHSKPGVTVIDEIDRSLHPMLVREFLGLHLRLSSTSQLIVTTHESNLLDLDLLRRDEIWFAEKDTTGATHIYSLADFKVRKDLSIRKHYLQGRFGAVPYLGDFDRLVSEADRSE